MQDIFICLIVVDLSPVAYYLKLHVFVMQYNYIFGKDRIPFLKFPVSVMLKGILFNLKLYETT